LTEVFIRKTSGLTRVIGPWDALAFAFMTPGIANCNILLLWTHQAYPGVNVPIAVIPAVLLMFIPALLYIWFSIAMPRSGGEYIWGSRILSPAWGFSAGWVLTTIGASWAGSLTYLAVGFGINNVLRTIAISELGKLASTHPYWLLANSIDAPIGMMLVGGLLVVVEFLIMWRGARAAMILSWIGVISGVLSLVIFDIGVLTGGGLPTFIERFNMMSGTTYQAVLDAAKAAKWPVGLYDMNVSLGAGITFVALNTLGSTYTANIMGEVKEIRKAAIAAMLGALILLFIFWELFYSLAYYGFSGEFWAAASYFAPGGAGFGTWQGWPLGTIMPVPSFMLVYANPNAGYAVLSCAMAAITWFAAGMGAAFGPVRNIFAYSFDRVLPTFFAKTDKRGSPWAAVLLGLIIGEIFLYIFIYQASWIAYTILSWFFAWAIVGVVGMVFPFTSRGKAIFEKSPEIVKKKIGGVPVLFILGLLTFIISVALDYSMLLPFLTGLASSFYIWITITMFIAPSFIIYYVSRAYHKMKGVPMELQFKQIPPD